MRTVSKYALAEHYRQTLVVPLGARVLTIQFQGSIPTLWVEVDTDETARQQRYILMIETGEAIPDEPGEYITTLQEPGNGFITHWFVR